MKKSIFGILILMESLFLGISTGVAFYYGEDDWMALLATTLFAVGIGSFCKWKGKQGEGKDQRMTRAASFLVVTLSWVVFSVIGMIPYIVYEGMDVSSAFFETMSGFTTTGATCIADIDSMTHGLRFWRNMTQWMGGLGIVVFTIALIPAYEMKNSNVFSAEVTGIGLDKLRPKIGATARRLLAFYLVLTILCAALYWAGPMDVYDAICHAMSTIATGGFSTHTLSIGYFHSSYVEYVCCFFMLVSSINFSLFYYLTVRRGRVLFKNEELRAFLSIVGVGVIVFFVLFLVCNARAIGNALPDGGIEQTLRTALFHVSTTISSSGFSAETFDYVSWGEIFWMPTVLLMAIGGCAGSTAGGIKVVRILVCCKSAMGEFVRQLHPRAILGVRMGGQIVPDDRVRRTLAFIFIYLFLVVCGMFVFFILGADVDTALGSCISMLSNVGPATGTVGPASNFAAVPEAGKWFMSLYMLIGRLEIYTVLFLLLPMYWRERK